MKESVGGVSAADQRVAPKIIQKKAKFNSMRDKLKKRGFAERVAKQNAQSCATYLNEELKRHIGDILAKKDKIMQKFQAEKTRLRRQTRQE